MNDYSSVQEAIDFIDANDGWKYAFRGWTKEKLIVDLFDGQKWKKYFEVDDAGIKWLVVAEVNKRMKVFYVGGILIRKDLQNTKLFVHLINIFMKHYRGYTIEGLRGKSRVSFRDYSPERLVLITHRLLSSYARPVSA